MLACCVVKFVYQIIGIHCALDASYHKMQNILFTPGGKGVLLILKAMNVEDGKVVNMAFKNIKNLACYFSLPFEYCNWPVTAHSTA